MKYLELFLTFAKIGVMTFGGGYSMLPMLQRECVEKKKWITDEELMNYYAIGQCTPGIIAVNTATFVGVKEKGIYGGIIATFGVVFPSFFIITLLASLISAFKSNIYFIKAFNGIRIVVCALIFSSIIKMIKKSKIDFLWIIIAFLSLILQLFLNINSIYIVILTVIFGIVYFFIKKRSINDIH